MKVLVIGGSGFIGSHITDELSSRNHEVVIFDKHPSPWIKKNQKMVVGEISLSGLLEEEISKTDVVFHMAGIADIKESSTNAIETIQENVVNSSIVMELCSQYSVRFMYGSTVYVYSKHGSFYRASKQSVETFIEVFHEEKNLDYTILRYGSLYGPRSQKWNGVKKIVSEIVENKKIIFKGSGKEKREYIHVSDAAKMSVDLMDESYKQKAITISGLQILTQSELIEMIIEIIGKDVEVKFNENSDIEAHYNQTPYQYVPKRSTKLVPSEYIDLGQGILELVSELTQKE
tara:strand:+ start:417 stop:1283 length:867 start_codon:yes stop_codon:yes gene_type:complete